MSNRSTGIRSARGFSLLEMMFVVALMGILSTMAMLEMSRTRPALRGDGAMRVLLGQMRTARELAITQRRFMRVTLRNNNEIEVMREEVPGPATTVLSTVSLEGGIQYSLVNGLPDTPDAFGKGAPIDFGVVTNIKFTPDGTLVNQDGQSVNGSVFFAIPNLDLSARAITVLGSTGRIRAYRWNGRLWKLV